MTNKKETKSSTSTEKKEELKNKIIKERVKKQKDSRTEQLFFNVLFILVLGLLFIVAIIKFTPLASKFKESTGGEKIVTNNNKNIVYEKSSLAPAIDNVYDSVVMVISYADAEGEEELTSGTGFIYKKTDDCGYVITNQHVVSGAKKVELVLSNDEVIDGKVLEGDEYLDLAIIKISKDKVPQIAELSSSEDMKIGDTVFTVGSPMGYEYRGSVTSGILSGKDRLVSVSVSNSSRNDWVMKVLQIDAPINPGNSGGPLVNASGKVIGITSMKLVRDEIEGMGFAIPMELAMAHIEELEKGKKIDWPVLGISMADISDAAILYQKGIMIDKNLKDGVVVASIAEGSGASKSSLEVGDVIIKINGEKVKNSAYLRYELYKNKPGESIEITYNRNGKEGTAKISLTSSKAK